MAQRFFWQCVVLEIYVRTLWYTKRTRPTEAFQLPIGLGHKSCLSPLVLSSQSPIGKSFTSIDFPWAETLVVLDLQLSQKRMNHLELSPLVSVVGPFGPALQSSTYGWGSPHLDWPLKTPPRVGSFPVT